MSVNFCILILSFNHPQLTERCVRSALQFHKNIFLVHNGSRPENVESLRQAFPEITHIVLADNRGYSGGANHGIRLALQKYDWVLFLTNDCELIKPVRAPEERGWVAPLIWRRKVGRIDSLGGVVNLKNGEAQHWRKSDSFVQSHSQKHFYIPGSAFWIDQESWAKLGGFHEPLGTYWEDIELSLRAPHLNVKLLQDPGTEILHRVGKTCHKHRHYTTYLYQRNRFIVSWQHSATPWRFGISYWKSMAGFSLRQLLQTRTDNLSLVYRAVTDGWRERNSRPLSPDDRPVF